MIVLGDDFTRFMDLCVQCRACEAVCPSSVPFGRLMEGARTTLQNQFGLPLVQTTTLEIGPEGALYVLMPMRV